MFPPQRPAVHCLSNFEKMFGTFSFQTIWNPKRQKLQKVCVFRTYVRPHIFRLAPSLNDLTDFDAVCDKKCGLAGIFAPWSPILRFRSRDGPKAHKKVKFWVFCLHCPTFLVLGPSLDRNLKIRLRGAKLRTNPLLWAQTASKSVKSFRLGARRKIQHKSLNYNFMLGKFLKVT